MGGEELQSRIEGTVTTSTDAKYENLRRELIWNQLTPARYPQMIVQVASEQDVIEAVRFARTQRMKVAVRGGGHSWVGFALRDDSFLLDLGRLTQVSVDHAARTAVIQPAVSGQDLTRQLAVHDLAFPVGHCPTVSLSGFLLNGGLGWNFNSWGPACFSIEAANAVTADGNLIMANQEQNADLLWAIRGAGPGFFAVVTKYFLKLYPLPHAITTSTYFYPLQQVEEVGTWAASIAGGLPKEVELTIFFAPAPPTLAERCRASNGFVCILSATAFVDTQSEAAAALSALEGCPVLRECLGKELHQFTPFDTLFDMGGMLWPGRQHYLADTLWSNSSPAKLLATLRDRFVRAPSPQSLAVLVFATGADSAVSALPDAAFSMTARALLLCYAIWDRPADNTANAAWHRETIAALDPFAVGHYVGESDIIADPVRAERSFANANWQRLQSLRRKYDPDGLFHGHFSAR